MSRILVTKSGSGVIAGHHDVPDRGPAVHQRPAGGRADADVVWRHLAKASFAVVSYVTPQGEPRSSGVVYALANGHLYLAVAPDSWKARQIADGAQVAVTVPIRRGGLLALLMPIPPATISFQARATVHPAGTFDLAAVSKQLEGLVPKTGKATLIELTPENAFVTYGIGVSLMEMRDPAIARGHVPVGD